MLGFGNNAFNSNPALWNNGRVPVDRNFDNPYASMGNGGAGFQPAGYGGPTSQTTLNNNMWGGAYGQALTRGMDQAAQASQSVYDLAKSGYQTGLNSLNQQQAANNDMFKSTLGLTMNPYGMGSPQIRRMAHGGHTTEGAFVVGDSKSGKRTGHEEMVVNPTGAPVAVVPLKGKRIPNISHYVDGTRHGRIGYNDPRNPYYGMQNNRGNYINAQGQARIMGAGNNSGPIDAYSQLDANGRRQSGIDWLKDPGHNQESRIALGRAFRNDLQNGVLRGGGGGGAIGAPAPTRSQWTAPELESTIQAQLASGALTGDQAASMLASLQTGISPEDVSRAGSMFIQQRPRSISSMLGGGAGNPYSAGMRINTQYGKGSSTFGPSPPIAPPITSVAAISNDGIDPSIQGDEGYGSLTGWAGPAIPLTPGNPEDYMVDPFGRYAGGGFATTLGMGGLDPTLAGVDKVAEMIDDRKRRSTTREMLGNQRYRY